MISVVMPMFNAEAYLSEAIDSVLTQSYQNFELIIIDDGSTDSSVDIVNSYQDKRIILIRSAHDFIQSLNLGFEKARGKYIARMDADDIMLSNRLQVQFDYMEQNPGIDICGSWVCFFGQSTYTYTYPTSHEEIVQKMLLQNSICHPSVLIRVSSLYEKMEFKAIYKKNYIYAEDYKLWTDLVMNGLKFSILPEVLLKYRISESQVTNTKREQMQKSTFLVQFDYVYYVATKIVEKEPDYFDAIDSLIGLFNEKKMNFAAFQYTIYGIYLQFSDL